MQSGDEAGAAVLLHNVVTGMPLPVEHLVRLVRKIQFQYLSGPDPFSGVVQVLQSVLAKTRV